MSPPAPGGGDLGSRIGHYTIEQRLGAGGMGVVYKARDAKLGRAVAIKFLPPQFCDDPDRRDRFLQEARAASNLDHPNVGTIHGIEETAEGYPYMVMSFYEGSTLGQILERGPVPLSQALDWAIQTANGLREAHARGVVHRDIKPSNLIVTPQGLLKILDFGLAKFSGELSLTKPGAVVGTAAYMSPEQAQGQPTDERTDIWSLGVVLFQMLAGRTPFPGENYYSILNAIVSQPVEFQSLETTPLRAVVERAIEKDLSRRYRTIDEMLAALEAVRREVNSSSSDETMSMTLAGAPAPVSQASAPATAGRRRWRRPAAWGAAIVLIGLVAAGVKWLPLLGKPEQKSVAVLPFEILGAREADQGLKDGLQETLTSRLTELERFQERLWVVPASEVRRRDAKNASDVGKAFGANLAVTGSVQRVGPALRLSLNLVDATTLRQLGSAVLDEPSGDWLRLQDKAVRDLTALLAVPSGGQAVRTDAPIQPEVYETYLKALGLLQRWDRSGNLTESARALETVVAKAPRFVPGHVALATAYWTLYTQENDPNWVEKARAQVIAAQKLDTQSAPAHEIMGRIRASAGQRDLAVLEFQEALKLDPRSQVAIAGMARAYEAMGRKDEALASYRRVVEVKPQWWNSYNGLGSYYYRQRRFPEAEAQFRKALELTPDNTGLLSNLGNALKNQGRTSEAVRMFERAIEVEPNYVAYHNAGTLYFQQDDFARSAQMFEKALELNAKDYRVWGSVGQALSRSGGSAERQREVLGKAIQLGENLLATAPANSETRSLLASYHMLLGDPARAREHLASITPGSTEDIDVWVRVAVSWMALGDKQAAGRAVRLAASLGATRETFAREPELRPFLDQLPKENKKKS